MTSTWDWHPHPEVWLVVAALEVAFLCGTGRRRGSGPGPGERCRVLPFTLGVAVFWLASDWPLHDLADDLFSAHMLQHLLLALVVPPLLLLGLPEDLLQGPLARGPVLAVARALTRPWVAFLAFNAVLGLVHVPTVVELMSRSEPLHAVLHAALLGSALLLWIPVLGRLEELPRMSSAGVLGYMLAQSALPMFIATYLTNELLPVYLPYAAGPRPWGISPALDQKLAGAVMGIGALLLGLYGIVSWVRATPVEPEDAPSPNGRVRTRAGVPSGASSRPGGRP